MQRGGALLSSMLRRESGQAGTQLRLHESIIGAIDLVLFRHRVSLSRGTCWVLFGTGNHEPRRAKELMCSKLRHHRTFRGHSSAVYVLAIDHESRYVLSGSDDAVVKIWSLSTGVLLNSCRGHEVRGRIVNLVFIDKVRIVHDMCYCCLHGEVTDVKVSCDSKMAASSSTDTVIRVWSLQAETLGHPVAVLMGCNEMINYLD